jgi:hypothetical protein
MSRKMYALLLPVLAVAAMAMTAGAAQAAPKWEICEKHAGAGEKFSDSECEIKNAAGTWEWVPIPNGLANRVRVVTFGTLTLSVTGGPSIRCQVLDRGFIWNVEAGGLDEITGFENYECELISGTCPAPITVTPGKLAWKTELAAGPVDKIIKPEVKVFCNGTLAGTFTEAAGGPLSPKIEKSSAVFTAATGELEEAGTGVKAKVEGTDHLLTNTGLLVRAK